MRKVVLMLLLIVSSLIAKADHITGGEMYYVFIGNSGGTYNYSVTLKLFMRCNSGRQFPDPAIMSVFNKQDGARMTDISTPISSRETIQLTTFDPCITDPPQVCYEVAYYNFVVSVPPSSSGYTIASQVNYRIRGISNLDGSQVGATYTCEIPGSIPRADGPANNSAVFTGSDLVVVCAGNYFSYSFAARDPDGDPIRYSFCSAYASTNGGANGSPSGMPPYPSVPYNGNYSSSLPLGGSVTIDPNTGLITGIAPSGGVYVVTVCAEEIRGGVVIGTQRKDLQINIADCNIAAATLERDYMLCGTTRNLSINNLSTSPLIRTTDWEVYNPAGISIFTSTNTTLNYTFATNGIYKVRLIVNRGGDCSDTTTVPVYVFPGLAPDFTATGICINKPTVFTDQTTLISGAINSWTWDFGEPTTTLDVSTSRNDVYTYPFTGLKNIRLIVTTTDGCRDTVYKITEIIDKPRINLAFKDTLICVNDQVQLLATGIGNFVWSPLVNMINSTTSSPTVSPAATTKYYVDLETDGCRNRDSVLVSVVDHVTLQMMADTTICRGDTIRLHIVSDGLQYAWTSTGQIMNPVVQNPMVITQGIAVPYQVLATIGGCSASAAVDVSTVAYPVAYAGADTIICYHTAAQLQGTTDGNSWQWTPASTLSNASLLNPVAKPVADFTNYILTVHDTKGCPKPGYDTIGVTMLPRIIPFAGHDTAVTIQQPLQLHATGGTAYVWSPPYSLSDPFIADPVAIFNDPSEGLRYKVQVFNIAGCYDTASLKIKVFATLPTVFVPTAFTPNNDGKNDILLPVAVGMKYVEYFNIYSRWGQLLFSTKGGAGWDGRIGGQQQGSNTYVWMVKAVDYNGKIYFRKGTVTLIR